MQQLSLFSTSRDHIILTRSVNGKIRYYLLEIDYSLFGEYILNKIYGGLNNKKPTRILREYFSSLVAAKKKLEIVAHTKKKKGYAPLLPIILQRQYA